MLKAKTIEKIMKGRHRCPHADADRRGHIKKFPNELVEKLKNAGYYDLH
jgi:hypothetical protein